MALFKLSKQNSKNPGRAVSSAQAGDGGRIMSDEALASLGAPDIVYIRETDSRVLAGSAPDSDLAVDLETRADGRGGDGRVFVIYGADGSSLAVMRSREAAFAAALQNDLDVASLH